MTQWLADQSVTIPQVARGGDSVEWPYKVPGSAHRHGTDKEEGHQRLLEYWHHNGNNSQDSLMFPGFNPDAEPEFLAYLILKSVHQFANSKKLSHATEIAPEIIAVLKIVVTIVFNQ